MSGDVCVTHRHRSRATICIARFVSFSHQHQRRQFTQSVEKISRFTFKSGSNSRMRWYFRHPEISQESEEQYPLTSDSSSAKKNASGSSPHVRSGETPVTTSRLSSLDDQLSRGLYRDVDNLLTKVLLVELSR